MTLNTTSIGVPKIKPEHAAPLPSRRFGTAILSAAHLLVFAAACGTETRDVAHGQEPIRGGEKTEDAGDTRVDAGDESTPELAAHYLTSTILFNDEGENTYVNLLTDLDGTSIKLEQAIEFAGWSGAWAREGKLFISDGEGATMTRYTIESPTQISKDISLGFSNEGAAYADSAFVSPTKAYVFADQAIAWNPAAMESPLASICRK